MFKYRVTQIAEGLHHFMLEDNASQVYLVRALGSPPPIGARLNGARPHLGFGLLECSASAQVYRVIFESTGGDAAVLPPQRQTTA